jgi:hypothetical protein
MKRIFNILTLGLLALALVAPGVAMAQDSGAQGYGDSSEVLPTIDEGSGNDDNGDVAGTTAADDGDSLPFTGAELGVLAGAGGLLVLMGFALRRSTFGPSRI